VIVGVQATAARMSQETVAAQDMLTRFTAWQGRAPESVAADTTYGNGEFLQWLADRIPTCGPATVSTERVVHSSAPSVSLTKRNTIATSVLLASPSTTVVEFIGIGPLTTSEPANVAVHVRSEPNAPVPLSINNLEPQFVGGGGGSSRYRAMRSANQARKWCGDRRLR